MTALPDAWRIEVFKRAGLADPEGAAALREARELGCEGLESIRFGRGYLLSPELSRATIENLAEELFVDPVLEQARLIEPGSAPQATQGTSPHRRVLVARRRGVMDPTADSIRSAFHRNALLTKEQGAAGHDHVQTFRAWEIEGTLETEELRELGARLFANEVIEELLVDSEALTYGASHGEAVAEPIAVGLRGVPDEALMTLSKDGCLSLNLIEMKTIQAHYDGLDRDPTPAELETIAQTWSEHCKHKTFTGRIRFRGELIENLLKETIVRATRELDRDFCISVFHDNAGIVAFEDDWDLCFKVETHNHPSAIDPYGGAGTGIGGVIRDILGCGLGALPIANTDCFFVGPQDLAREDLPAGSLHPRRILRGVVAGVADYGNRMGIPTVSGGVWFHPDYVCNPLVYAGTLGLIPRECATKSVEPGDIIVVVGGRTGRDGIHGATFSSIELSDDSAMTSSAAVQIGDPITEKRVMDGLLRARDLKLYRGLTDCGAGGLSSAVGEMGEKCGAHVDLEKVPLKYSGLTPSEIWISEAQERMVLAVQPENLAAVLAVFAEEDVDATAIGTFNGSGFLTLSFEGQSVAELSMEFLHDGTPKPEREAAFDAPTYPNPGAPKPSTNCNQALLQLLSHPNVQSKEWIIRRYDHSVQGLSSRSPFSGSAENPGCPDLNGGPGDAAVLAPLPHSKRGIALGVGANPNQGRLDPGAMAAASIDEALRNVVAVGGDPDRTAILDNFSWGNCDRPQELGALVLASKAACDTAIAFGTPFISGKDSLNNEYRVGDEVRAIPPTLLISAMSIVPDVSQCVSMDLKASGNRMYLVGSTASEFGGSLYFEQEGLQGGRVPQPDLKQSPKLLRALHAVMQAGLVRSAHDLSEGGLAVAAAEMAFACDLGLRLNLTAVRDAGLSWIQPDSSDSVDTDTALLFSESCTRFLVEVAPADCAAFERGLQGLPCVKLGEVIDEPRLVITASSGRPNSSEIIAQDCRDLRAAWTPSELA